MSLLQEQRPQNEGFNIIPATGTKTSKRGFLQCPCERDKYLKTRVFPMSLLEGKDPRNEVFSGVSADGKKTPGTTVSLMSLLHTGALENQCIVGPLIVCRLCDCMGDDNWSYKTCRAPVKS